MVSNYFNAGSRLEGPIFAAEVTSAAMKQRKQNEKKPLISFI